MNHMHEALKKKILEMRSAHHGSMEHAPMEDEAAEGQAPGEGHAPQLEHEGPPPAQHMSEEMGDAEPGQALAGQAMAGQPGYEGSPMHLQILEALASGGQHHGRGAMSLHERAGDKVREKMASIEKHKKGKG